MRSRYLNYFSIFVFLMGSEFQPAEPKWEGKTSAELKSSPPHHVWPIISDFCNVHRIFPGVVTCSHVEGVSGQPGVIRYCAGAPTGEDEGTVLWAREKLVADHIQRLLSYEVVDSNMGFRSYVATIQVVQVNSGDEGCVIEWSFECDPIQGWRFDDFKSYVESTIQGMAKKIEDLLFCLVVLVVM